MNYLRPAVIVLLGMLAVTAVGLLSGPPGFGPGEQSAEAALLSEVKKLLASDAQANDSFGWSVAISGDTAVVGAIQQDAGGLDAGAAYVFQRDGGGAGNWGEVKKLLASDTQAGDWFGRSVAVSGDTAVVGAPFENTGGSNAGAAYVFQRNQGGADNWGEVKKLLASDAQAINFFGSSVAVSGDTAVVGAFPDAFGSGGGAAYVFRRDQGGAGNWGEVKKLTASDAQDYDFFGTSVAVSGDTAVVGADLEDAGGSDAGAAYVFQRDQGGADNWGEAKKLLASDAQAEDQFGISVAVSGDTAVVGAWLEKDTGLEAGAAYVFQRDQGGAGNWGEVKKLTASGARQDDHFGHGVAVSGDTAVVGADLDDAGGSDAGAAYVFRRDQGGADNWGEVKKLAASDAQTFDEFGFSVAVSGDTAVVGAPFEDAGGSNAGAAYVFEQTPTPTFDDVPTDHFAFAHIEAAVDAGITAGCSADPPLYCPDQSVTRAQMAVFIILALEEAPVTPTGVFDDVPPSHWAAGFIERLAQLGVTSGCATDPLRYCPDAPVTRAQMAVFIVVALGEAPVTPTGVFDDVPPSHFAAGFIEKLADLGITAGCSTEPLLYCPNDPVTRAQMAVFIVVAFNLLPP